MAPLTTKPRLYYTFGVWVARGPDNCAPEYWHRLKQAHEWSRVMWLRENPPITHD
jgi:hypothetical protein